MNINIKALKERLEHMKKYAPEYSPIETEYNGCLFRSRLEARWAVFLDYFEEKFSYEKEGYNLSKRYLPDFWLPRMKIWLEIKGVIPTLEKKKICEELAYYTSNPVAIAWGVPGEQNLWVYCNDLTDSGGGSQWWEECFWSIDKDQKLCICSNNNRQDRVFTDGNWNTLSTIKLTSNIKRNVNKKEFSVATKARFEFENK